MKFRKWTPASFQQVSVLGCDADTAIGVQAFQQRKRPLICSLLLLDLCRNTGKGTRHQSLETKEQNWVVWWKEGRLKMESSKSINGLWAGVMGTGQGEGSHCIGPLEEL